MRWSALDGLRQVIGSAFQDVWADLWTVLLVNLVWLLSNALIIPGPLATLGIFYYANRLAHGEVADLDDFWIGVRRYWKPAVGLGLINAVLMAVLIGDTLLTGWMGGTLLTHYIQGLYLALLAIWMLVQLYAIPFLFEQQTPSVTQALRNGAVMLGRNVGFSAGLSLATGFILVAGSFLFMLSLAFGGMFLASLGNHAVLNRMQLEHPEMLME